MTWVKRDVPSNQFYSEFWEGGPWQINKTTRPTDRPWILIDAKMPQLPVSPVMGSFATLELAQEYAASQEPPDWSGWDDDE